MPTDAYARFLASLELDFDRWHDGDGYDLDALAAIDPAERGDVVHLLASRAATWREIEALERVDIPPAFMAIRRALRDSASRDTRLAAAAALDRLGKLEQPLDTIIARELLGIGADAATGHAAPAGDDDDGCTRALLMAEAHATPCVKEALLAASARPTDCAMHAAALLCYLTGVASEPFDWALRPLFLRLGAGELADVRRSAFDELCTLVGMQPGGVPNAG